jgi:hypothetical protein
MIRETSVNFDQLTWLPARAGLLITRCEDCARTKHCFVMTLEKL